MCAKFVYEHLVDKKLLHNNHNGCNWNVLLRSDSDLSNTQDDNH